MSARIIGVLAALIIAAAGCFSELVDEELGGKPYGKPDAGHDGGTDAADDG